MEKAKKSLEIALHDMEAAKATLEHKFGLLETRNKELSDNIRPQSTFTDGDYELLKRELEESRHKVKSLSSKIIDLEELIADARTREIDLEKEVHIAKKESEGYKERVRLLEENRFNLENRITDLTDRIKAADKRLKSVSDLEANQEYQKRAIEEERRDLITSHNQEMQNIRDNDTKMLENGEKKRANDLKTTKDLLSETEK